MLAQSSTKILADVQVNPNNDGLPGVNAAIKIVGALLTFGLIAAVAGIAIGSMVWAAVLVGSAVTIVNFFSHTNVN
jgi:hypothetical protein